MSTARSLPVPAVSRVWLYLELTKPDVTFLVVLSTLAGFYLASTGQVDIRQLVAAVLGTTLVGAGTATLNHYFERESDALMRRTANRPLPLGLLRPSEAVVFGLLLIGIGAVGLGLMANWLSAALALATTASYLAAYTPLKKHTTLATLVGAFPGAAPPLIGWAAATGSLTLEAWVLYAILFLWQFPHFMAIAWMYREDYARAGIRMLPVVDPTGVATYRQILGCAAALLPVSLLPTVVGLAGTHYFFGASVLGLLFMQVAIWASRQKTNLRAKWLMHASVAYLPLLFALMMFDRISR
jgi:protoheme IX farnesyltransferase